MARGNSKRVNLALQGGGAHGAVSWGVLDRLLEDEGIEFDSISGTSAGAVNAVALAYGLHLGGRNGAREKLEELWREVSDTGAFYSPIHNPMIDLGGAAPMASALSYYMFDAFTRAFSPYQFNPFDLNPLRMILERCIDFNELRDCRRAQLYLSATNVKSGKAHIFRTRDMSVDVVLASACLPFLFQAVEIDGEHYWDGGYMGNPSLFPFFYESEYSDILIVHVNPIERDEVPHTAGDIMNRINEISFNSALLGELRAIGFVHKLLGQGWLKDEYRQKLRDIRIHSVRSDKALENYSVASKFDTDWRFLTGLRDKGREIADVWLTDNRAHIGVRSSVDIRALYEGAPV